MAFADFPWLLVFVVIRMISKIYAIYYYPAIMYSWTLLFKSLGEILAVTELL